MKRFVFKFEHGMAEGSGVDAPSALADVLRQGFSAPLGRLDSHAEIQCGHESQATEPLAVCGNCKRTACDECADTWKVCECCSGGICDDCQPSAMSKRATNPERRQYLCTGCAGKYGKAREILLNTMRRVIANLESGEWVDTVIYELESAIDEAKRKADL